MIDAIAMAVGTLHAGTNVDVIVVEPAWLDSVVAHRTIAVALEASVVGRLSDQVHEDSIVLERIETRRSSPSASSSGSLRRSGPSPP